MHVQWLFILPDFGIAARRARRLEYCLREQVIGVLYTYQVVFHQMPDGEIASSFVVTIAVVQRID